MPGPCPRWKRSTSWRGQICYTHSAPGRGRVRKAAQLSRRGLVAGQTGLIRVSLAEDICIHRNPDLEYCGKDLDLMEAGVVEQNLNLCAEHMEEH
eukprot:2993482-Pyramimonas_sp.AAC.1